MTLNLVCPGICVSTTLVQISFVEFVKLITVRYFHLFIKIKFCSCWRYFCDINKFNCTFRKFLKVSVLNVLNFHLSSSFVMYLNCRWKRKLQRLQKRFKLNKRWHLKDFLFITKEEDGQLYRANNHTDFISFSSQKSEPVELLQGLGVGEKIHGMSEGMCLMQYTISQDWVEFP